VSRQLNNYEYNPGARGFPAIRTARSANRAKTRKAGDHEGALRREHNAEARRFAPVSSRFASRLASRPSGDILRGAGTKAMRQLCNVVPVLLGDTNCERDQGTPDSNLLGG
jgi:hypothetical protein